MRRKHPFLHPIASELFRSKEIRFRNILVWVGVVTAFLIIAVGWATTKPWEVPVASKTATKPVPKFVNSLEEIKGMIEEDLQSIDQPRSNETQ